MRRTMKCPFFRKLLLITFLATAYSCLYAQEMMEVVSLSRIDNDLRAQVSEKQYDDDGNLCALLIVETNSSIRTTIQSSMCMISP